MPNSTSFRSELKEQNKAFSIKDVVFRQLISKDVDNLLEAGFPHPRTKLKQPLTDKIFQQIGFRSINKGLVAYHTQEKQAIGFLQLVKHSKWLYSIRYAFTNPSFRNRGVASGLFNFAFSLAKKEGGRKVFLNVYPTANSLIRLYNRLGFRIITNSYEVWAQVGVSKSPLQHESHLNALDIGSRSSRNSLFEICQRFMGSEWIDFFETNSDNLINGFSGDFRHFFFKSAFIDDSTNSFALVFRRPMFKTASAEVFTNIDSDVLHVLEDLIRVLHGRKINHLVTKLFNINDDSCVQLIKKSGFYEYHSLCMGKSL